MHYKWLISTGVCHHAVISILRLLYTMNPERRGYDVHFKIMVRLGKSGHFITRKTLLSTKNTVAHLQFPLGLINKLEDYWNNILWTDETKVEPFGSNEKRHVWRPNSTIQHENCIQSVKHCGGLACFAASGPGPLAYSTGKCEGIHPWTAAKKEVDHAAMKLSKLFYQRTVKAEET